MQRPISSNLDDTLSQETKVETEPRDIKASTPAFSILNELFQIKRYIHVISTRVQYLQGLIEHERSIVAQVTEIKRELKSAHRNLEKLHSGSGEELGSGSSGLVNEATRFAWQSYRSMVTLEERMKGTKIRGDPEKISRQSSEKRRSSTTSRETAFRTPERPGVYIPTGATTCSPAPVRPARPQTPLNFVRQLRRVPNSYEEMNSVPRAVVVEQGRRDPIQEAGKDTIHIVQPIPRLLARRAQSVSTMDLIFEETDDEDDPQPRASVILRVEQEESKQGLALNDPNRVRRGSCTGTTITDLIMCGIDDNRFVLPYFHHIKHHEVRALKEWLAQRRHVERSGSIGRMEKILHCLQLLQTGCRYESVAVIFSRSPMQVKASCQEVVQGLLSLHADTVNGNAVTKQVVQEYMPLWGLWDKYKLAVEEAVSYYGFQATQIAKVIGALNLYIGRWRMQGGFAVSGPVFSWGHVFVLESGSKPVYNIYRDGEESGSENTADDEDDDSTSTIRPAAILASRRFEID